MDEYSLHSNIKYTFQRNRDDAQNLKFVKDVYIWCLCQRK